LIAIIDDEEGMQDSPRDQMEAADWSQRALDLPDRPYSDIIRLGAARMGPLNLAAAHF
jgi:hypothetical protein